MTIRVLHILNSLGNGGAESFIFNMYRNINRDIIQFDFLLRSKDNNPFLIDEVSRLGGEIYITPEFPRYPLANYKATDHFFEQHHDKYKVIHVHANALLYITPFLLAKKYKIQSRILHSHNTATEKHLLYKEIHRFNRLFVSKLATHYFSCGYEAGEWMFKKKEFEIINNAIDTKKYIFNEEIKKKIRHDMKLENGFVIGHVGRFVEQKNHAFLIDIFNGIYNQNPKAYLILIGDGELLPSIKEKVNQLNLSENVFFLGLRQDVTDLLQAFDVFVFPSLFEGLPIALIEAQAAGLPCFVSNNISSKAKITDLVNFLSIEETSSLWADTILKKSADYLRTDMTKEIESNDFDIVENVEKIQQIYMKMAN